jgi:tRNA threonylcarbamoyladenosine biosynthesis protein TsaE
MLNVGREIGTLLSNGSVVLLDGPMGAGKTTLTKGIVEGFRAGSSEDVSSPTFPIVHEYRCENTVFHLDLYRLESEGEVLAIGIEELLEEVEEGSALMLVEWGDRFPNLWPASKGRIEIREENDVRAVTLRFPSAG